MRARSVFDKLQASVHDWFTTPETNAAGSIGIYRILFCLFYLWYLSTNVDLELHSLYQANHMRLRLIEWIPDAWLSPSLFVVLESTLVAALVLLMLGAFVPVATALVLVLGGLHEAFVVGVDGARSTIMLTVYIPLFMSLACHWGKTYSIDALVIERRDGQPEIQPSDSSWIYNLAARAALILLAALFMSGAISKVGVGGTWLENPEFFANILLDKNVDAALAQMPLNPLAPLIAQHPALYRSISTLIILFEGSFFLVLFSRKLRRVFVPSALIFHSINGLWLLVTFTPVLVIYGLFVDWQSIRERLWPQRLEWLRAVPQRALHWGAPTGAIAIGVLWNGEIGFPALFNLGGLLDSRTMWLPILPLAAIALARALSGLIRPEAGANRAPL